MDDGIHESIEVYPFISKIWYKWIEIDRVFQVLRERADRELDAGNSSAESDRRRIFENYRPEPQNGGNEEAQKRALRFQEIFADLQSKNRNP